MLFLAPMAHAVDSDGDALDDPTELLVGTDPASWDTDADTLSDGSEVLTLGSDPLVAEAAPCGMWTGVTLDAALPEAGEVRLSDLDADGDLDVVAVGWDGTSILVRTWLHDGAGGFGPGLAALTVAAAGAAVGIDVADLDADGLPDLITSFPDDGTVGVSRGLGTGQFGARALLLQTNAAPAALTTADADGNGWTDVLVGGLEVTWLLNQGGGVFTTVVAETQFEHPVELTAAVLEAGGPVGFAWVGPGYGIVFERVGQRFEAISYGRSLLSSLRFAEADGDPTVETFAVQYGENLVRSDDLLATNPVVVAEHPGAEGLVPSDLDGNGEVDLVVSGPEGVTWYPTLDGVLRPASPISQPADGPGRLAVGDLDGDGDLDVVATARAAGRLTAFLGHRVTAFDLGFDDGDGVSAVAEVCALGTDPYLFDTDGGGARDGQEAFELTDALDPSDDGPGLDGDGDGLSGFEEIALHGTDPDRADSDGDGLDDGAEVALGTDPLRADTDGDGLRDATEVYVTFTSPRNADTDGDGLRDRKELVAGTDPRLADTDGDGTDDGLERAAGADPLTADPDSDGDGLVDPVEVAFGTDGLEFDSDYDGLADGEEFTWHTDPRNRDTDGDSLGDGAELWVLGTDPLGFEGCDDVHGIPTLVGTVVSSSADLYAVADIDGDGAADLLSIGTYTNEARWHRNLGEGLFDLPQVFATPASPTAIAPGDLDADGDQDIAVIGGGRLELYENLGGGVLAPAVTVASGIAQRGLAIADIDLDGVADLVAKGRWYAWQGGASFVGYPIDAANQPVTIEVGDLDADGDPDLVTRNALYEVWRYTNLGGGAFGPAELLNSGCADARIADLNGDGHADLSYLCLDSLYWLEGPGLQVVHEEGLDSHLMSYTSYALGDFDGDGALDLAYGSDDAQTFADPDVYSVPGLQWKKGRGDGTFEHRRVLSVDPADNGRVVVGDLDGDGLDDLAWAYRWFGLGTGDGDGDGLSTAAEVCIVGTNQRQWDSDLGGVSDGAELDGLTDPLDPTDD
jgi:hypothetical protein